MASTAVLPIKCELGFQVVDVLLGTPPQKVRCKININSSDLQIVLASPRHEEDERDSADSGNLFDASKSSTNVRLPDVKYKKPDPYFVLDGVTFSRTVRFPRDVMQDTVELGGVQVHKQAFLTISNKNGEYSLRPYKEAQFGLLPCPKWSKYKPFDGRMTLHKPSLLQKMMDRGLIDKNVIGLKVARFYGFNEDLYQREHDLVDGELRLGEVDHTYADRLITMPISELPPDLAWCPEETWHLSAHSLSFGDLTEDLAGYHVLFDLSTIFIEFPTALEDAIAERLKPFLPGSEDDLHLVDPKGRCSAPPLIISLGPNKVPFSVPPSCYMVEIGEDPWTAYMPMFKNGDSRDLDRIIVLGYVFFAAFYTVFDFDQRGISLCPLD